MTRPIAPHHARRARLRAVAAGLPRVLIDVAKLREAIAAARRAGHINDQVDLAAQCGWKKSVITRLLAGRTNPQVSTIVPLTRALGVTLEDLV